MARGIARDHHKNCGDSMGEGRIDLDVPLEDSSVKKRNMQVKYYITRNKNNSLGLFVTSRFEYWLDRVRLSTHLPLGEEAS